MKHCILCKTRYKKGSGVTFHKFPSDKRRLELWLKKIEMPGWRPKQHDYICSIHFSDNSFIKHNSCTTLKKCSIPTISCSSADLECEVKILNPDFIKRELVENEEVSVKTEQEETNILEREMVSVKMEPAEEPVTKAAECKELIEIELIPVIKSEPDNTDNELGDGARDVPSEGTDQVTNNSDSVDSNEDIDDTKEQNKTEKQNFSRSDHLKRHTGEGLHTCHVCDKNYTTASALKGHNIRKHTHMREKPYSCNVCGETFYTTQQVRRHNMLQHGNHKIYKCDICNKRFAWASNLKVHKQTHIKNPFTYLNPDSG